MGIKCALGTIQDLTNAVKDAANEAYDGINLTARPWSHYNPRNTRWYLVASGAANPANPHGKIFFRESQEGLPDIVSGLWIEKGIGRVPAKALDRPEAQILTDSWAWHEFLEAMRLGQVAESIRQIAQAAGQAVNLEIRASGVEDTFRLQARGDELEVIRCPNMEELESIGSCTRVADLSRVLSGFSRSQWIYIDFYLGVHIILDPAGKRLGENWSPEEIWQRVLLPWRPWLI